uniref:PHD-type domain-containing protein n=1 Tax=Cacopsylla melanoneura TaxID=428564 RepID=A0A8D8VWF8_9HEMI
MNCHACKKELSDEGDDAACGLCKQSYHFQCTTVSESSWKKMSMQKKQEWICHVCRKARDAKLAATQVLRSQQPGAGKLTPTTEKQTKPTEEAIVETDPIVLSLQKVWMADFGKFQKNIQDSLKEYVETLNYVSGQVEDIAKDVKIIQKKMIEVEQRQDKQDQENKEMKTLVRKLEVELMEMKQEGLNNKLEISGLPNGQMDVTDVAKRFVEKTGLDPNAIGSFTVDKPHKNEDRRASIVVGFRTIEVRNQVFGKIRAEKLRFKTKDVLNGSSDESPLYVNEYLSPYYRKLFYEAKKIKNEKDYAYLWVRDGKILLKKTQDSNVMRLMCMGDLAKI